MNYFELFEIPITLKNNKAVLVKKYYSLSKQFHPDHFINENDIEHQVAQTKSAEINKAYKTLLSVDDTIGYLLQLQNALHENEKNTLPNDFLIDMMEINEQVMELDLTQIELKEKILQDINAINNLIHKEIEPLLQQDTLELNPSNVAILKTYYLKKKYINRILSALEK